MIITLTRDELQTCIRIGKERYTKNLAANVTDQRYSTRFSSIDCDVHGVIGEYSFLSAFGLPTDRLENTGLCSHARDRGDAIIDGKKIDIKAPVGLGCTHIMVKSSKTTNPPFAYALMVIEIVRPVRVVPTKFTIKPGCDFTFPTQSPASQTQSASHTSINPECDTVRVHFKGFIKATDLIQPKYLVDKVYGTFYEAPLNALVGWDALNAPPVKTYPALPSFLQQSV